MKKGLLPVCHFFEHLELKKDRRTIDDPAVHPSIRRAA
jgi:hypothetical protein